jgi:hypothetical protein
MTALARTLPALAFDAPGRSRHRHAAIAHLSLRPDGDGCSLVTPDGELVFKGQGTGARRQCLQFAQRLGVLTLVR